jgi:hypothetical protein
MMAHQKIALMALLLLDSPVYVGSIPHKNYGAFIPVNGGSITVSFLFNSGGCSIPVQ